MEKIKMYSKLLKWIFMVSVFGVPIVSAGYWYFAPGLPEQAYMNLPVPLSQIHWNEWTRWLGFLVTLPSLLVLSRACLLFRSLFQAYELGAVFSMENAELFHRIGKTLVAYTTFEILQIPLLSLALTFQNPPGEKMITASLSSNDFFRIVVVMIVFVLGWIHKEAFRMNEDSKLTI